MKKLLALLLAAIMVLSLAACASTATTDAPAQTTEAADTTTETAAEPAADAADETAAAEVSTVVPGKLTVATSPDFAPYEFYALDENNDPQLAGFDVALAQYVADYLGLELDIIPMDFDGVLNELATGNVDLGMAGLSPDPARADAMDFSDPTSTTSAARASSPSRTRPTSSPIWLPPTRLSTPSVRRTAPSSTIWLLRTPRTPTSSP